MAVRRSYGFRPRRSATQAMERLRTGFIEGHVFVAEFDIRSFFGHLVDQMGDFAHHVLTSGRDRVSR